MGASNGFVRSLVVVAVALAVIAIAVPAALAEQAPTEKGEAAKAGSEAKEGGAAKEGSAAKEAMKSPRRRGAAAHGKFVSDLKALLTEAKAAIGAKDTAKASAKIDEALKLLAKQQKKYDARWKQWHKKGAEGSAKKEEGSAKKPAPKPAEGSAKKEESKDREPASRQDK